MCAGTAADPRLMLCVPCVARGLLSCTRYHRHEQELMNVSDRRRFQDMIPHHDPTPRSHHATSMDGHFGTVPACLKTWPISTRLRVEGPNAGSLSLLVQTAAARGRKPRALIEQALDSWSEFLDRRGCFTDRRGRWTSCSSS